MMVDSNFYRTLPKKRMAAGAIFLDEKGKLLIVKPAYRPEWLIPGGIIEEDESPRQACIREVEEELNIDTAAKQLLCVDYTSKEGGKSESLQFVFFGGVLTQEEIKKLQLPVTELVEYRFATLQQALSLLSPKLAKRLPKCLQAIRRGVTAYLEDGEEQPRA